MATTIVVDATGLSSAEGQEASNGASNGASTGFGLLSDVDVQDITELEVEGDEGDEGDEDANEDVDTEENAPTTTVASADSTTSSLPENFLDCQGDPNLLTETLRAKTVAELKTLCGTCEITIKKGKSYKRKDELIESLVEKVCSGASA